MIGRLATRTYSNIQVPNGQQITLKTIAKCKEELEKGNSVVIDNTNPTSA
jgi:hypothetical protein